MLRSCHLHVFLFIFHLVVRLQCCFGATHHRVHDMPLCVWEWLSELANQCVAEFHRRNFVYISYLLQLKTGLYMSDLCVIWHIATTYSILFRLCCQFIHSTLCINWWSCISYSNSLTGFYETQQNKIKSSINWSNQFFIPFFSVSVFPIHILVSRSLSLLFSKKI